MKWEKNSIPNVDESDRLSIQNSSSRESKATDTSNANNLTDIKEENEALLSSKMQGDISINDDEYINDQED